MYVCTSTWELGTQRIAYAQKPYLNAHGDALCGAIYLKCDLSLSLPHTLGMHEAKRLARLRLCLSAGFPEPLLFDHGIYTQILCVGPQIQVWNIRINHEGEGGTETSVPRITVKHHKACQVITNVFPMDGFFLSHIHTNNWFFILLAFNTAFHI